MPEGSVVFDAGVREEIEGVVHVLTEKRQDTIDSCAKCNPEHPRTSTAITFEARRTRDKLWAVEGERESAAAEAAGGGNNSCPPSKS